MTDETIDAFVGVIESRREEIILREAVEEIRIILLDHLASPDAENTAWTVAHELAAAGLLISW